MQVIAATVARRAGPRTRRESRRPVSALVELTASEVVTGMVVDISDGGLRVLVEAPLPLRDRCVVLVHGWEEACLVALVEVVWARRRGYGWFLGLEFIDVR